MRSGLPNTPFVICLHALLRGICRHVLALKGWRCLNEPYLLDSPLPRKAVERVAAHMWGGYRDEFRFMKLLVHFFDHLHVFGE
jgi:hypothetical protein